jgi:hypothetical protein
MMRVEGLRIGQIVFVIYLTSLFFLQHPNPINMGDDIKNLHKSRGMGIFKNDVDRFTHPYPPLALILYRTVPPQYFYSLSSLAWILTFLLIYFLVSPWVVYYLPFLFFYPYMAPDLHPAVFDFLMLPLAIHFFKKKRGESLMTISVVMTYFHLVFLAYGTILLALLRDEKHLKQLIILSYPLLILFGWYAPDYVLFYSKFGSLGNLPWLVYRIIYPLGYLGVLLFINNRSKRMG